MQKRQLILNDYKTAEDGLFTLSACKITKASQEQNFVSVPGRFAPLDLSTVLTDGQPYYGSAKLAATLESSEGTREERQSRIDHLVNLLDGYTAKIIHPDFPGKYMVGRVEVATDFNGLANCSVQLSATLEPWLYNDEETVETTTVPSGREGKNLLDLKSYAPGTNYGTTVSTTEAVNGVTITQTKYPNTSNLETYNNGYVELHLNSIPSFEEYYTFSCDVEILSNPLSATYIATLFSGLGGSYSSLKSPNGAAFEVGKKYRLSGYWTFTDNGKNFIELRNAGMSLILSNIQLEKGTTATEYEPPATATSAGGNNLLDIPDTTVSGSHAYANVEVGDFELPPGDYTISAQYVHKGTRPGQLSVREYGTLDGYIAAVTLQPGTSGKAVIRFTVPADTKGIRIYLYSNVSASVGNTSVTISNVMVNEGSTALDFEPFYILADQLLTLTNEGRLAVVPVVDVVGSVSLTFDDKTHALSAGTYQLPDLYLTPGKKHVVCSGNGTVTITYREAVLAG